MEEVITSKMHLSQERRDDSEQTLMFENLAMNNSNDAKNSFWRKNSRPVPGRPSPKKQPLPKTAATTSFHEFENSVKDAWAIEDCCRMSENAQPSVDIQHEVAHAAALTVLSTFQQQKQNDQETTSSLTMPDAPSEENERIKFGKFAALLNASVLDLEDLRSLSWGGIPPRLRPTAWRLLAGYLPANLERRESVLERKRLDYRSLVDQYYHTDSNDIYHQIHIDIPRMSPEIILFQQESVQQLFERVLFIWAIRHPASGYVQGINDLLTPFFIVFLQEILPDVDFNSVNFASIPKEKRDGLEADAFWCLSKFLDGIQDNYIFAQLGIQHKVNQLKELMQRIDLPLHKHLQQHGVDYLQFSFRWINNLLTRELPLRCTVRIWDTYLSEADGLAAFQLYVCAAFLQQWRKEILNQKDFQNLMLLLQRVPCERWTESEVGVLLAEAFRLKFTYADAPNHLQSSEPS